ncbi:MAG: hypothetical protein IKH76_05385 [Clostridiales bacterium]|nr:hypothetical protein [Clostridiales bacterium]
MIDTDAMLAAGLEYKGASIACTDKTILRIYFKASEDTISGTTFTYGGKEITPVEASGMYCLEFFEINPQDIFGDNAVYNIGIDISGTYVNLIYDTARYYNNLFQPTESQSVLNFRPVIRAMYQYSQSAKNYNG